MSAPVPPTALVRQRGTEPRADPTLLWRAVIAARTAVAEERRIVHSASAPTAHAELLDALEAYVDSLHERCLPIPYALRDELRLQRATWSSHRGYRYSPQPQGVARDHRVR
jgi:hypothetical protein